ncbi:ROK family transcriptional regulator [Pseudoflavitalea sp. X16]|uniref:ROK family transcriptional regulator n=1 Tax=Paraflavitalea devenefica TaxID=2716334 RepID=UPI00142042E1|nr:ROK family transcriptional regulator [Paraflavitalea devenefica]NII25238.1 ROK family transcriptional regulator [Paraflavitalea devenefica]
MPDKQTIYRRKIIKHLYFDGSLSCTDLSLLTKKSVPLTSRVLNELIEEGYVLETGLASSTGGRRAQMYSLRNDLMYVVSIAMDQLITRMAVLDMHNNYVGKPEQFELKLANNAHALHELKDAIAGFIGRLEIPKEKIAGVGIGMPGFVDVRKGINHSFLKASEGSIVHYIESHIGLPVLIDNDSSLVALAELRLGAARNRQNVMVINISWGIGLGLILKGELFRGYNGFAGEFSHIPVFMNNKMCSCGKSGCLETEASLLTIADKAVTELQQGKISQLKDLPREHVEETIQAIVEAAVKGDKLAVGLFSEAGYNIGRGIAILIHLLNPELVVLSGRGAAAGRLWLPPIQQAINEHCIPKIAENTEVIISTLCFQAGLTGAAALVMEHFDKNTLDHLSRKQEKVA